jgi:hypothetical protein
MYKIIRDFLSQEEGVLILDWVNNMKNDDVLCLKNNHMKEIGKYLNGVSTIFDISKTDLTKYITNYQSTTNVSNDSLPHFFEEIITRMCIELNLPKENLYLQVIDMEVGGKINAHYDASIDGYINYKCNISVLSDDYKFYLGKDILEISQSDLYSFEASLYRHWTDEFKTRRLLLSFGFILPYSALNRSESDPRIRLSKRIQMYFQK